MNVKSCYIKCKLINDKNCFWNGCRIQRNNQQYIVSPIAPIILSLPCMHLKYCFESNFSNLGSFLLSSDVYVQTSKSSSHLEKLTSKFAVAWKSQKFSSVLKKVKFASTLTDTHNHDNEKKNCCKLHYDDELLSWFVLFVANSDVVLDNLLLPETTCFLKQGMTVWTSSFPFSDSNHAVFHNCSSKGVLCNIIDDVFLLIDACCLPGSQGACVFDEDFKIVGIIVCPLELKTGQLAGMTILCSWGEISNSLSKHLCKENNYNPVIVNNNVAKSINNAPEHIEVVSLHHCFGWGSGVVVLIDISNDRALIATCRHVVEPIGSHKKLQATFFCGLQKPIIFSAKVIYATKKDRWLDFALLEVTCERSFLNSLSQIMSNYLIGYKGKLVIRYSLEYIKGTSVFAKGHCLFNNSSIMPTVTCGEISNVVYSDYAKVEIKPNLPILLHSNCIVLDGASGGGIFSTQNWNFYGIIVNNVKEFYEEKKHILFPNINFVLPASLFMPYAIEYALGSHDFSFLEKFASNSLIENQWFLKHQNEKTSHFHSKL